jgi:hypothetical protein
MTDVVEIAKERRIRLATEIAKLDDFIRMAEMLVKYTPLKPDKASDAEDERAGKSTGSATVTQYSGAAGDEAKA